MEHLELLRKVELSDCKAFIEWYEETHTKSALAVKEAVERLSKKELSGIWSVFMKWVTDSVESASKEVPEKEFAITTILVMSSMATFSLANVSSPEPQVLSSCVKSMNDALKFVTCKKTGASVCDMSEKYWKIHPELELEMCVNAIRWLLNQALLPKATAASIKSVWSMKESLLKIDPEILSNSGLLDTFMVAVSNSKFIGSADGRKSIALLFNHGTSVVEIFHGAVKKFIPVATVEDCESLGEIYFSGWRLAIDEEIKSEIEFSIQDIMYNAVVAHRKPLENTTCGVNKVPMNKLLFHLLHAIHRQKKQRTAAILIYNLYKPILWRYLEASNGLVRANSLCLFFDAFPFESGDGIDEDEVVRNKQWALIQTALVDPVPLVRTIAIQGASRVMAEYWEIIPVHIIKEIITVMLRKLLYDSSSPDVRAHVVKGLIIMLESNQTHVLLEKMIPLTNKIIHDPHEKVRAEYVSLLIQIQTLKINKLWEIIDVKQLVIRLAVDSSKSVCRRLVMLLAPFYHPKSEPEIVFQRCLRLVIDNRVAARKFYQHASCCVSIQQMAQLILIIWKFLRNRILKQLQRNRMDSQMEEAAAAQPQRSKSRRGANAAGASKRSRRSQPEEVDAVVTNGENKENQGSSESENEDGENEIDHEEFNESHLMGLIDVVCILLNSNKTKFKSSQNLVYWDNIKKRFNKTCSLFFRYFRNSEGLRSILYLYGILSSSSSPLMMTFVKSQLKALSDDSSSNDFGHLVDVMLSWGNGEDVLEFISDNVQGKLESLSVEQTPESSRTRKSSRKKRVSFERLENDKPMLGLRLFSYLLQHPVNKKALLRKNLRQVEQFCENLKRVLLIVENDPEKLVDENSFLYTATALYVTLVLVLTSAYKREDIEDSQLKYIDFQDRIMEILDWSKRLLSVEDSIAPLGTLGGRLVSNVLAATNNLVIIQAVEWKVCHLYLTAIRQLVERFPNSDNLVLALNTSYHSLVYIWSERSLGKECDLQSDEQINLLLNNIFESCTIPSDEDDVGVADEGWSHIRDTVRKIMELCRRYKPAKHSSLRDVIRILVRTMQSELTDFQIEIPLKTIKDLPETTSAIIAAFRFRNTITIMMFDEFFELIKEEDDKMISNVGAITKLIKVLASDPGKISKETLANAISSIDHVWSSDVGDLEKNTDKDLTTYINNVVSELKKEFKL